MATKSIELAEPFSGPSELRRPARERLVLVGASGHARVILETLKLVGQYEIVGFVDSFKPMGLSMSGYEIIGTPEALPRVMEEHGVTAAIVGVGDNWTRARIANNMRRIAPGIRFITAVHPAACVAQDATIGEGTVVMAGAIIGPGCKVGDSCIVNTRASLDHDSAMDDFSSLGPGVTTGGCVRIGSHTAIGIGATILQDVRIGSHTVIGAAAAVLRDIPDQVVAYGIPARVVRHREPGDRYLREPRRGAAAS